MKSILMAASLYGASGILLGAFGAHFLKHKLLPDAHSAFETAVYYQLIHAVVLLVVGSLLRSNLSSLLWASGVVMASGVLLFSGSIYLLATRELTGLGSLRWLGPVTPLGGILMIAGWLLLLAWVIRLSR